MRILLCHASAGWSTKDVTTGYRSALIRAGHDVRDYRLDKRLEFVSRALPDAAHSTDTLAKLATDGVLAEATYHRADLVLVVSAMHFHEAGLWLLDQHQIPTAVLFTESPYQDNEQAEMVTRYPAIRVCTNDRLSAAKYGWTWLAPAYDADVHRPTEPDLSESCDVLFVGTGFAERQRLLERIDWTGIHLRLRGLFPCMTDESPIRPFYEEGCVNNADLPRLYASAKMVLNPHRASMTALTPNPRTFEAAACGAFQLTDFRVDTRTIFGQSIPMYDADKPSELESLIRYYVAHDHERQAKAEEARLRVQAHTFDARVSQLMAALAESSVAVAG